MDTAPSNEHYHAPYEVRYGLSAILDATVKLEPHEILHHLRSTIEESHRMNIFLSQVWGSFPMEDIRNFDVHKGLEFRNKTVPIYLLHGDKHKQGLTGMLGIILHNYLYRRWFQPYRSDIEHRQFIAKVINLHGQPHTSNNEEAVALALRIHSIISRRLDGLESQSPPSYKIRPLFRAVSIIVPGQNCHNCSVLTHVAFLRVLIVLTGETKGLSAPISFSSIADKCDAKIFNGLHAVETDLETAIGFIMHLEQREEAVFGPQPDPVAASKDTKPLTDEPLYEHEQEKAERFGWDGCALVGPSSKWVDAETFKGWTGFGAQLDAMMMTHRERILRGWHARNCTCEKG